jgi:hypothetical protein
MPGMIKIQKNTIFRKLTLFESSGEGVGYTYSAGIIRESNLNQWDCLCSLVVRVPGYRFRGPGSIPGANRFSEK